MTRCLYICFLLLSLSVVHVSYARHQQAVETESVRVLFDTPLKKGAEQIVILYDKLRAELEETFGWEFDFKPEILLIKESSHFQRITGHDMFVAFAVPQKNLIVIDYSKMNTHLFSISITLKHEMCHLLLHHHIRRKFLPKWLDEGICQWVSDGISELNQLGSDLKFEPQMTFDQAIVSDQLIPLHVLAYGFPKNNILLSYEESKSIVEYIIREFGVSALFSILNDLKNHIQIHDAILLELGMTLNALEEKWHENLKKRITWFVYFSIHLYEILFFIGGLITIYGFIRLMKKKRDYQDDEEEEWQEPD
jgi:hypothetical protein